MFAYFKKHKTGKYNIVFTKKDLTKVNELLKIQQQVTKPKRNPIIEKGFTLQYNKSIKKSTLLEETLPQYIPIFK